MNLFIIQHGLTKYAVVSANLSIAEKLMGRHHAGEVLEYRTIPVRDLTKARKREFASVLADPETVYINDQNTNEWVVL